MGTSGLFHVQERVLAVSTPTRSDPIRPGPMVVAMVSMKLWCDEAMEPWCFIALWPNCFIANASDSCTTGMIAFTCSLAACSGMMPPVFACISAEEATTLDSMVVPFSTTAAVVSSQEVSIARIII